MKRQPSEIERNSQRRIIQLIEQFCDGKQKVFADKVGIGKPSVSQYVSGSNFPTNIRAAQIAKAFKVSPLWVMGFDSPMFEGEAPKEYDISVVFQSEGMRMLFDYAKELNEDDLRILLSLAKRLNN